MPPNSENENIFLTVKELIFKTLVLILPISFYWVDRDGVLKGCNQKVLTDLEIPKLEDFVGKHITSIVTEQAWINCQHVMDHDESITIEEEHPKSDGKKIVYLSIKSPLHNQTGEVIGLIGISIDITTIREIEQLKKQTQLAEEKAESMNLVAASIAHELRTPLLSISVNTVNIKNAFSQLISTYKLAEQANLPIAHKFDADELQILETFFEAIKTETQTANIFIDILLMNLSPSVENQNEIFNITECVNEALARYPLDPEQRELIHWNAKNDFVVKGNRLLLIHVVFNLIKNALYYIAKARKDNKQGKIHIWLELDGIFNKLYFKDTGTGISPDILPHIFDRFFSKTHRGAGIGLTFCKMVMEALGGTITCQSIEGDYTLFALAFPCQKGNN